MGWGRYIVCCSLAIVGDQPREKGSVMSPSGYIAQNGYAKRWVIGRGDKYVHRLVVEEALGRELTDTEVVHHVNGDKLDNRLENLEVASPGDHIRKHIARGDCPQLVPQYERFIPCAWCGVTFERDRHYRRTCSLSCGQLMRRRGARYPEKEAA